MYTCKHVLTKDLTVNHLNQHFSAISTDPNYKIPPLKDTVPQDLEEFTEWRVFRMLDTIKTTAMGLDGIPEWFIGPTYCSRSLRTACSPPV